MADLLVADARRGRIIRLVGEQVDTEFGTMGSGLGQFRDPASIAATSTGRLVIADRGNDRIIVIDDLSGSGWQTLGTTGSGDFEFRGPSGVTVDAYGGIWIADSGNRRVVRIDDIDGSGWAAFGVPGVPTATDPGIGRFRDPVAVQATADGPILVADPGAARVVRIDGIDGSGWVASPFGALMAPTSIAPIDSSVVVADFAARRVVMLDPNLAVLRASNDPRLSGPAVVRVVDGDILALVPPLRTIATIIDTGTTMTVAEELRLGPIGIGRPVTLEGAP
jgi:hypothetical protein